MLPPVVLLELSDFSLVFLFFSSTVLLDESNDSKIPTRSFHIVLKYNRGNLKPHKNVHRNVCYIFKLPFFFVLRSNQQNSMSGPKVNMELKVVLSVMSQVCMDKLLKCENIEFNSIMLQKTCSHKNSPSTSVKRSCLG